MTSLLQSLDDISRTSGRTPNNHTPDRRRHRWKVSAVIILRVPSRVPIHGCLSASVTLALLPFSLLRHLHVRSAGVFAAERSCCLPVSDQDQVIGSKFRRETSAFLPDDVLVRAMVCDSYSRLCSHDMPVFSEKPISCFRPSGRGSVWRLAAHQNPRLGGARVSCQACFLVSLAMISSHESPCALTLKNRPFVVPTVKR